MALPDFSQAFVIQIDASTHGIGVVLPQKSHPLAFFSKKLSLWMTNTSTYVRELYAITQVVAQWRNYLVGTKFIVEIYHQTLKDLVSQVIQTSEQKYYLTKLLGYKFSIEYRTRQSNAATDALSRLPIEHLQMYSSLENALIFELQKAKTMDPELKQMHQLHGEGNIPLGYLVQRGLLMYKSRFYLPRDSPLIDKVLHEFHATPQGGHIGVLKTYKRVPEQFYWKGMKNFVEKFVAACWVCQ